MHLLPATLRLPERKPQRRIHRWVVLLVLIALASSAQLAVADSKPVRPMVGKWCGLTGNGGVVQFTVTEDAKWITGFYIQSARYSFGSTENSDARPWQVMLSQFIYRTGAAGAGAGSRCVTAPCHSGGGGVATTVVRGFFDSPDTAHGTYNGATSVPENAPRRGPARSVSNWVAWPAEVAPCPTN